MIIHSRYRVVMWTGVALVAVWAIVFAGYRIADRLRPTPERLTTFIQSVEWSQLAGQDRREKLEKLVRLLNALDFEARREVRLGRSLEGLFAELTEEEKGWFVEQTLPTGVRQMLDAFEALPEEKRQRAVQDSVKRMREARARMRSGEPLEAPNDSVVTEEMQRRMVEVGMKTFYGESSAQTKAELAPVLEEMQRLMESGRYARDRRRR
jgi:hypothetical protein